MAFLVALNFAQSSGLSDVLALLYCLCLVRIDLLYSKGNMPKIKEQLKDKLPNYIIGNREKGIDNCWESFKDILTFLFLRFNVSPEFLCNTSSCLLFLCDVISDVKDICYVFFVFTFDRLVIVNIKTKVKTAKKKPRKIFMYFKGNIPKIKEQLKDKLLNYIIENREKGIDNCWESFKDILIFLMTRSCLLFLCDVISDVKDICYVFLCSHSIVFLMAFLVALNFAQSSGLPDVNCTIPKINF
jgi:hypothetical protein